LREYGIDLPRALFPAIPEGLSERERIWHRAAHAISWRRFQALIEGLSPDSMLRLRQSRRNKSTDGQPILEGDAGVAAAKSLWGI